MKMILTLASAAALLAPLPSLAAGNAARGERLARANCASCHAIGRTGASPNPKSPPFRTLSRRYPLKDLEEALAEGIVVGHEGSRMPMFEFTSAEIQNLMAHLARVQTKRRR